MLKDIDDKINNMKKEREEKLNSVQDKVNTICFQNIKNLLNR